MKTDKRKIAFLYLRLSRDEYKNLKESDSIANQRLQITDYCKKNNITIAGEFVDDGFSGGNFERPEFENMLSALDRGKANMVITKDLSRLGRDMNESSYYAEKYFPESHVRYIAINDNFDSNRENDMAPFIFLMNEMYLRDGSKKVKATLKNKRENGLYCACPPYGYKKETNNKNRLVPDPETAPVVERIFRLAASGRSTAEIASALSEDGVLTPLKYRAYYRDNFSEKALAKVSDVWNKTTVKRILKNPVYLGHTILGKSRKVSVKSKKKEAMPEEEWAVTENTHTPLISESIFEKAKSNLGKSTKKAASFEATRYSIFAGLVFCKKCGHALCSGGTVYKGEREKYWYLTCSNSRKEAKHRCEGGARIKYAELLEIVRKDLNELLSLDENELNEIANALCEKVNSSNQVENQRAQKEKILARLSVIDKMIPKCYEDNAQGRLSDERLYNMVADFEEEEKTLKEKLTFLDKEEPEQEIKTNFLRFYKMAEQYSEITTLTREILTTFVERIEVDAKKVPEGTKRITHSTQKFEQEITIYYKFIGDLAANERKVS